MKIKYLGLLVSAVCLSCLPSSSYAVNPIPNNSARVVVCAATRIDGTRGVFNPFRVYGPEITYTLPDASQVITVTWGGQSYKVDYAAATREAMLEWRAAVPGLRFRQVVAGTPDVQLEVLVDSTKQTTAGGRGIPKGVVKGLSNASLIYFQSGFDYSAKPEVYDIAVDYMAVWNFQQYLDLILRIVAKHELGHVLGFLHTDLDDEKPSCILGAIYRAFDVDPTPPIMLGNLDRTLNALYHYHDGLIRIEDIQISPQEADVARRLFVEGCPVAPQQNATTSRVLSGDTCPQFVMIHDRALSSATSILSGD